MAEANSREMSVHNETTERTQQDDRGVITLDEDISLGDAIFQHHEGKALQRWQTTRSYMR
jgi:hypothetical protein